MGTDLFLLGVEGKSPGNRLHLALGSGLLLVLVTVQTSTPVSYLASSHSRKKGGHIRGRWREVTKDMEASLEEVFCSYLRLLDN